MNKKIACIVTFVLALSTITFSANAAETISITSTSSYTATIDGVGAIWRGNIPTRIAYPSGTYSQKLEFQIQGILPYSVLADRATGTEVEFELWSEQGKKIASDTVYSFDWNPVGPNTLVSMYLSESDAVGNPTMIVRTIYELSTTGLLTRYLKSEQRFSVSIGVLKKPASIDLTGASYESNGISWSFTGLNDSSITGYELGFRYIKSPGLDPTQNSNYGDFMAVGKATAPKTQWTFEEIKKIISPYISDFSNSSFIVAVRAVNSGMSGDWGKGYYFETKFISQYEAKIAAEASRLENEKQNRIDRCTAINAAIPQLTNLMEMYISKYPENSIFQNLKSQMPGTLNCSNAADPSMSSVISSQDWKISSLDTQLTSAMQLADNPPAKRVTITCIKGKLSKKVTGTSPKCPAGYKKK